MKLKDLLKGRDKLRKYEELEKWRKSLDAQNFTNELSGEYVEFTFTVTVNTGPATLRFEMSDQIRQLFLAAIDAEIKKMEEE